MKTKHLGWLFLAVFAVSCTGPQTRTLNIANGIMESNSDPDLAEVRSLAAGFAEKDFSTARLAKYPDTGLDRLYDALFRVSFFFPEHPASVDLQAKVLEEKLRRGHKTDFDVERMHKSYVGARRFNDAAAIAGRFPGLKYSYIPPTLTDETNGAAAWRAYGIPGSFETVVLKNLPLARGPRIVISMFPGCEITEAAVEEILADPALSPLFRKYGMLLTLRFDPRSMTLWRDHFKFTEVYIAYKPSDFPGFDFDFSPSIYFMLDGKIKHSVSGWRRNQNPNFGMNEMRKGLSAISIATASYSAP